MSVSPVEKATPKQWLAVFAVVLSAFMAILDTSITNSSLQDIQGSLSASLSEGSWISTSYIVTEIIVIPLAAFFCHVFSTRKYLIINIIIFLIFSLLCGLAWDLNSMILFRAFQGIAGGALIPVAITTIVTSLPPAQQVYGFIMFGLATTFAPAIGPSLGGWLTSNYGWPSIFYINLLPGIPLILMTMKALDKEPTYLAELKKADWWGILFLSVFLGTFTIFLEEGNREDWLASHHIAVLFWTSVTSLILFIINELKVKNPVLDLKLLLRKNFLLSCFASFALGISIYAPNYITPIYLGGVLGYNALDIGMVMMWMGLPQLLVMPFIPPLSEKVDARVLMGFGFFLIGISFWMNSSLTLDFGSYEFSTCLFVRALAIPFLITPSTAIAFNGIEPDKMGLASGLHNMVRNLGGSVGIGLAGTLASRRYAVHFDQITEGFSYTDQPSVNRLTEITKGLMSQGDDLATASQKAIGMMYGLINRESFIMAYGDCFLILAVVAFITIGCVIFMNKVIGGGGPAH